MVYNYSRAESEAARLLAAPSSVLPARATNLRSAFESIARYRVMGAGTGFAQYAADHRLYDQLVDKGLVVVTGEGVQRRWTLAPEQLEKFRSYVEHFQAQLDAQKAAEEAEKQAAFEAHQAVLAHRKWAVMVANTVRTYGTLHGKVHQEVFTGPTGKDDAEAYAAELRAVGSNVTMVFEITEDVHA